LKILIILLCVAGFYINLLGKLVWFMYDLTYAWGIGQLWKSTQWPVIMVWNPYYSPIILHMKILMENYVASIQPEKYVNTGWYWTAYGLAPCSYDSYFFCKFGIIAILGLSAVIVFIAILILREIGSLNSHSFMLRSKLFTTVKKPS